MSLPIIRILATAAAGVLLLACGGEDSGDRPKPSATPLAEKQPEETKPKPAKRAGRGQLIEKKSADGKGIQLFGTDSNGVEFEASIGENATIPDSFPSDVPAFPNAEPMAALSAGSLGTIVTFKSSAEQNTIHNFYLTELPKSGWEIQSNGSFGGQLMIEATKGSRTVAVTIAGTSGDSRLSIVLSEED